MHGQLSLHGIHRAAVLFYVGHDGRRTWHLDVCFEGDSAVARLPGVRACRLQHLQAAQFAAQSLSSVLV